MHALQPKHTKLKPEDVKKLLGKFNIALSQLPKISKKDSLLPENCETGDVIRVERKKDTGEVYYRVVI
ncbi:DNA-directed RNA polymerase subunit H [Candidatus Pacearchaeota archaeon]|nr:DNA-directed RNA polymerase subunit H [Candidatus Pacearchaeota archaeon]|tara:strand:+ start:275 stop:478 length:204 start_codon:yes stop_codon:yes gene_type:complete